MEIVIKNPKNVKQTEVYKRDSFTWNSVNKELTFDVNVSPKDESWRLVYWDGKVKDLFESEGYTYTINYLFTGTEQECLAEIEKLGLSFVTDNV